MLWAGLRGPGTTAQFYDDRSTTWREHGRGAMIATAKAEGRFIQVCASLIPATINSAGRLRSCRLEDVVRVLDAVKQALPGADPRKPADIFAYVLDAIRAHKVAPTMPSPDA